MNRRARILMVALALAVVLTSAAHALDREAFTFTKYDLKLQVDPVKGTLAASGTVQLRNDSSVPQTNVALQITSTLQWTSILQDQAMVAFISQIYTSDLDHTGELSEAIVTMPQAVPPKGTITLRVAYRGTVPKSAARVTKIGAPANYANATEWDSIGDGTAAVRGFGYVTWFPVALNSVTLGEGSTMLDALGAWKARHAGAVFQVALEVPQAPAPAPSIRWNTTRTSNCKAANAICVAVIFEGFSTIPSFAIAPFETLDRPLVTVSHRPEHTSLARDYASALERWAPMQAEWFGPPKEKVQIVDIGEPNATPFDSGPFVFTTLKQLDRATLEFAMSHQLAHASFRSDRLWINEGLAHFIQAVVRERQAGRRAALGYLAQFSAPLVDAEKTAGSASAPDGNKEAGAAQSLIATNDPLYFRGKALYVWWMLRDMLGEGTLETAVKAYRPEQDTQPAYMQSLLEKTAPGAPPRNLEWFFDDWVYRDRGLPDLRVASVYPRKTLDGSYVVTVTVENLGQAGAEVPVNVISASGETTQRVIVHGKSKGVIRVQTPQLPTAVTVNDGSVPESDMTNNAFEIKSSQQ